MGRLVNKRVFILVIFGQKILNREIYSHANGKMAIVYRFKLRISQNRKHADKMKTALSNSYG